MTLPIWSRTTTRTRTRFTRTLKTAGVSRVSTSGFLGSGGMALPVSCAEIAGACAVADELLSLPVGGAWAEAKRAQAKTSVVSKHVYRAIVRKSLCRTCLPFRRLRPLDDFRDSAPGCGPGWVSAVYSGIYAFAGCGSTQVRGTPCVLQLGVPRGDEEDDYGGKLHPHHQADHRRQATVNY